MRFEILADEAFGGWGLVEVGGGTVLGFEGPLDVFGVEPDDRFDGLL